MQCKDIHRILRAGESFSGPHAQLHISACESCRLLHQEQGFLAAQLQLLDAPATSPCAQAQNNLDGMFANLQQQIAQDQQSRRQQLRQLPSWSQMTIVFAVMTAFMGFVYLFKPRPDLAFYPWPRMLAATGSFVLLLVWGTWAAQRPLHRRALSETHQWALWALCLLLPLLFAILPEIQTGHPASLGSKGFWRHTIACFGYGIGNALPLLLLSTLFARQERPQHTLVTLALAGGLLGNIALQLHCPVVHPLHLALGHATVGGTLLIASLGFFSWRMRKALTHPASQQ